MESAPPTREALAARYGRTPGSHRRALVVGVIAAAAVLVVVVAWVLWVGLFGPGASLESRDTAHRIAADGSVEISFEITTPPGTAVSCALQALNEQFAIVGWKVVEIPPGQQRTRSFVETIQTTEQPTTGLIYRCWLT